MSAYRSTVSMGLPVYNGERYLRSTLESIFAQTFADFEVVVCDNASTDGTREICMSYLKKDRRLHYHRNPRNLGAAPNYNLSFNLSSGRYFKWASHDDVLSPDFLSATVAAMEQNPELAICFTKTRLIDEKDRQIGVFESPAGTCSPKPHVRFRTLILGRDPVASPASGLMRTEFVRQSVMYGSYPCSDWVFLAQMSLFGRFLEIPEHLFFFRVHPEQSSKGLLASERARVKFYDSSLYGKVVLIKWLFLKNAIHAVNSSSIPSGQKLHCYYSILRWVCVSRNFRSLGKDFLLATHRFVPIFPKLHRSALDAAEIQD